MKQQHIAGILTALLAGVLLLSACGDSGAERVDAQPLTLATPAAVAANGAAGLTIPQQIVVVLVTPTSQASQEAGSQQNQAQTDQNEQGQAVAQAQPTAQAQDGTGGEQQAPSGEQGENQDGGQDGSQASDQELINTGEQIYSANCASCHQASGEGTSTYPALNDSELLTTDDPTSAIQMVVNGSGQMPAFGEQLSANEIAAVISYERNSWGNSAGVITAEQVSQVQEGGSAQGGEQTGNQQQSGDGGEQTGNQQQSGATQDGDSQNGEASQPQTSGGDQAMSSGENQDTSANGESQASVTQEQSGNVITIRLEIVVMTPESAASQPPTDSSTDNAQSMPTPEASQDAEATAVPQPTAGSETAAAGEAQTTTEQATPTAEAGQAEATATPATGESQATPTAEGGSDAGEATATPEGAANAPAGSDEILRQGEQVYSTTCAGCHQLSGEGNTAYPALNNSAVVTADDPTDALMIILNGRGQMPSFGGMLSDQEVAAVLSHERNSWDNKASTITVDQVHQARENGGQSQGDGSDGQTSQTQTESGGEEQANSVQEEATGTPAQSSSATGEIEINGSGSSGEIVIQLQIVVMTPEAAGESAAPTGESNNGEAVTTPSPEAAMPNEAATPEADNPADVQQPADEPTATPTADDQALRDEEVSTEPLHRMGQQSFAFTCGVCQQAARHP